MPSFTGDATIGSIAINTKHKVASQMESDDFDVPRNFVDNSSLYYSIHFLFECKNEGCSIKDVDMYLLDLLMNPPKILLHINLFQKEIHHLAPHHQIHRVEFPRSLGGLQRLVLPSWCLSSAPRTPSKVM